MHLIIMPKKQSWPPVISKREQERREKFRQRLSRDLDNTSLRVQRTEKEKKKHEISQTSLATSDFLWGKRGDGLGKDWRESLLCKPPHPPVSSGLQCSRASKYQVRFLKYEIM